MPSKFRFGSVLVRKHNLQGSKKGSLYAGNQTDNLCFQQSDGI